jgi:co-chaperonin GroES (HSP10)
MEDKEVQEQLLNNIENVDNAVIAAAVSDKVGYEFSQLILVKPLELEKVFKTLTVPEDSGEKDEDGEVIMQMTIKQIETESMLRKGVVIKLPASMDATRGKEGMLQLKVGDIIVYPNKRSIDFDLFKDSALVAFHEVLARVA